MIQTLLRSLISDISPEGFNNNRKGVTFVAVQKQSRYKPPGEGGNLANAHGQNYVTYVFADNTYPGDHNSFTQDTQLVESDKYEQWYIGGSGDIATAQLEDFNAKVPQGQKRNAVFFRVHNNPDLDDEIRRKLDTVRAGNDVETIDRIERQVAQRKKVFGAHWSNDGQPSLPIDRFPNLNVSFIV